MPDPSEEKILSASKKPLAYRLSPQNLEEFTGQPHLTAPGKILWKILNEDFAVSLILYGPPGTGKTAYARLLAKTFKRSFHAFHTANTSLSDLRKFLKRSPFELTAEKVPILFIDEIHHFNKSQQSILLPVMERGKITLIGATSQNPFFALHPALLSRSRVVEFKPLPPEALNNILNRALSDKDRGLGALPCYLDDEARHLLIQGAEGDARRLLSTLEVAVQLFSEKRQDGIHLSRSSIEEAFQKKIIRHDASGDEHYDVLSAFIKSIRGSDPNAALYWLAKMLSAGESPRLIARRLMISASEDIGDADPQALVVATSAAQALEMIGMPEGRIPLAQAACYLACAPKSNAVHQGLEQALQDVENGRNIEVPAHLRDSHFKGSEQLSRGQGYVNPHNEKKTNAPSLPYAPGIPVYYSPQSRRKTEHQPSPSNSESAS